MVEKMGMDMQMGSGRKKWAWRTGTNRGRMESWTLGQSYITPGASILRLGALAPGRDMGRSKDSVDSEHQVGTGRVQTWLFKWCEDWARASMMDAKGLEQAIE